LCDLRLRCETQALAKLLLCVTSQGVIRQDYLLRIIEQAAQAIARMLGATQRGDFVDAQQAAESAYSLLGVPPDLVLRMDSAGLAGLFAQPEKIRMLSKLLWQEGELLRAKKDPINGLDRQRKAVELLLEAQRLAPQAEDAANLQEMFRHVPTGTLAQRYQRG
jgi:hypothetical protein